MSKAFTYTFREFAGTVILDSNGKKKVALNAPAYYAHEVGKFKLGDKVSLVITNRKPKRTEAQNRYWFGVYIPAIIKAGLGAGTPLETHEDLARKFLVVKEWKNNRGQICYVRRSTADLTVGEFAELVERVREETGIEPPPPENYDLMTFEEMKKRGERKRAIHSPESE